jgi:hypothetical protein
MFVDEQELVSPALLTLASHLELQAASLTTLEATASKNIQ